MRVTSRWIAIVATAAVGVVTSPEARAADWPIILGTEEGQPVDKPIRPFGFVQVVGDGYLGGYAHGLSKPNAQFDGQLPTFNALDNGGIWGFSVRRARPGLRGAIPGTDQHVAYFFMAEFGNVPIARDGPALSDATVTFSYIPGARVRVGQFKLPMMDETSEANPIAKEWINYSLPASQLVLENYVKGGKYDGNASGFRDVGVEVFDTFQWNRVALSYAAVLGNGRPGRIEEDTSKDIIARSMFSWVFSGAMSDPHRQELSFFAWAQRGERKLDTGNVQRLRSGGGAHLEHEPVRFRAEVVYAAGALFTGATPPFAGQPLAVSPHGRAIGGYIEGRVRLFGHALAGLRYDELHRDLDDEKQLRVFRSLTPSLEYDITPKMKLMANYESRWLFAPHGTPDAKNLADTYGDRVIAQVTANFY